MKTLNIPYESREIKRKASKRDGKNMNEENPWDCDDVLQHNIFLIFFLFQKIIIKYDNNSSFSCHCFSF